MNTIFNVFVKKEAYIQIIIWNRFKHWLFYYSSDLYLEHLLEAIKIQLIDIKWYWELKKKSVYLNMLHV